MGEPGSGWLVIEPYYGGSHRHLVDGLRDHLSLDLRTWTMPPRKWKWRMRGAALTFARRMAERSGALEGVDGILTTSLLDAAALRGLAPRRLRTLPLVLYCHENQLRYPVRVDDRRDYHYGWTNVQSVAAADVVLWNSAWNRDSFLDELERFLRRMPDERPRDLGATIRRRSRILPVPFAAREIASLPRPERPGPCRVLWNHRWEHDKDPEVFFGALFALADEGLEFEVAVLGESFERRPPVFDRARRRLGPRIATWGWEADRERYLEEIGRADVVVSTARHEFQGLAVLEAAARGVVPLVPDDLAYREIWPEDFRYPRGELLPALRSRILDVGAWRRSDAGDRVRRIALAFDWSVLGPEWEEVLLDAVRASRTES